jgi:hypothetical protein
MVDALCDANFTIILGIRASFFVIAEGTIDALHVYDNWIFMYVFKINVKQCP